MTTPTFSVITSSYNQLPLLQKAKKYWDNQTFKDFEWIIADDGSSDGTVEWCDGEGIKYVTQPDEGYRLTSILNKATAIASGEYLVWVMADSYPREDFLQQLAKYLHRDRILNGLRMNVDSDGKIVSPDWRTTRVFWPLDEIGLVKVYHPRAWELMTLNSMCMSKSLLEELGGWDEGYKFYGRMDWDVPAHAFYKGYPLYWVPKAIVYHLHHDDRPDHPVNVEHFDKRLRMFQGGIL